MAQPSSPSRSSSWSVAALAMLLVCTGIMVLIGILVLWPQPAPRPSPLGFATAQKSMDPQDEPEDRARTLREEAARLRDQGSLDPALVRVGEALAVAPANVDSLALRASIHRARADHRAALADMGRVIELDPISVEHRLFRADLFLDLDEPARAVEDLEKAMVDARIGPYEKRVRGKLAAALAMLGDELQRRDDCAGALRALRQGLEVDPDNPCVHSVLVQVYLSNQDFQAAKEAADRALRDLDRLRTVDSEPGLSLWARAQALNQLGAQEAALHDYDQAIVELEGNHHLLGIALFQRGRVFLDRADPRRALADAECALQVMARDHPYRAYAENVAQAARARLRRD